MRPLILILGLFFLTSCLENEFDGTPVQDATNLNVQINSDISSFRNDSFNILSITPIEGKLRVNVEYSGGCQVHNFDVVWNGEWERDDYLKASLTIFHTNNGDACEGLIKPTLELDLKSILGEKYLENNTFISIKNGYNRRIINIHPKLATISQDTECLLNANIENSLCGQGVWQNNWLLLADSLGLNHAVWLQPVRYLPDVTSKIPPNGAYRIGVKLLFGFQTSTDDSCLTIPAGEVIPVEVNCISSL